MTQQSYKNIGHHHAVNYVDRNKDGIGYWVQLKRGYTFENGSTDISIDKEEDFHSLKIINTSCVGNINTEFSTLLDACMMTQRGFAKLFRDNEHNIRNWYSGRANPKKEAIEKLRELKSQIDRIFEND